MKQTAHAVIKNVMHSGGFPALAVSNASLSEFVNVVTLRGLA